MKIPVLNSKGKRSAVCISSMSVVFAAIHLCFYPVPHRSISNNANTIKMMNSDTSIPEPTVTGNLINSQPSVANKLLIARVWHGWSTKANAAQFEKLLTATVFPGFEKQKIKGYRGAQLLKRELGLEVEFTTIMWFESMEAVKAFAGEDYETAHIDPQVRSLFTRFDAMAAHLQLGYSSVQ
jgi:hypothetical protein